MRTPRQRGGPHRCSGRLLLRTLASYVSRKLFDLLVAVSKSVKALLCVRCFVCVDFDVELTDVAKETMGQESSLERFNSEWPPRRSTRWRSLSIPLLVRVSTPRGTPQTRGPVAYLARASLMPQALLLCIRGRWALKMAWILFGVAQRCTQRKAEGGGGGPCAGVPLLIK